MITLDQLEDEFVFMPSKTNLLPFSSTSTSLWQLTHSTSDSLIMERGKHPNVVISEFTSLTDKIRSYPINCAAVPLTMDRKRKEIILT
jgi:hypothetical protein